MKSIAYFRHILIYSILILTSLNIDAQTIEFKRLRIDEYTSLKFPENFEFLDTVTQQNGRFTTDRFHQKMYTSYLEYQTLIIQIMELERQFIPDTARLKEYYKEFQTGMLRRFPETIVSNERFEYITPDSLLVYRFTILEMLEDGNLEREALVLAIKNKIYLFHNVFHEGDFEDVPVTLDKLIASIKFRRITAADQLSGFSIENLPPRVFGKILGFLIFVIVIIIIVIRVVTKKRH